MRACYSAAPMSTVLPIPTSTSNRRALRYQLGALLALAALVRIAALLWLDPVVSNEGSEYLRLAQNLRAGVGYQGLFGDLNAEFPPLFPWLIALVSPLTGGAESAARIVTLALGTATILPVYGVAAQLGGRRAGLIGAALAALHGTLIALSVSTYAESTYFFLVACGLYCALRTAARWGARWAALCGATFGLAYLVRPEALVYAAVVAGFAVLATWRRPGLRQRGLVVAVSIAVVAGAIMTPYVAWLSAKSGYLRLEGKSGLNGVLSERIRSGLTYHEAAQALGPHLEPVGVFLPLDEFVVRPGSGGFRAALHAMTDHLPGRTLSIVEDMVRLRALGSVPLLLLAALGLVVSLWQPGSRPTALLLALLGASYLPVLLSIEFRWSRFLFPLALLLLPWAAVGAAALVAWIRARAPVAPAWAAGTAVVVLVGAVAAISTNAAWGLGEFSQTENREFRDAGRWLATRPPASKLIASMDAVPVYYAQARDLYLPWSGEAQVQAYLRKLGPDYLLVWSGDQGRAPYIADWLAHGVGGECARPARSFAGRDEVLHVYRWTCPATDPDWLLQWCPQVRGGVPACTATPHYVPASVFRNP